MAFKRDYPLKFANLPYLPSNLHFGAPNSSQQVSLLMVLLSNIYEVSKYSKSEKGRKEDFLLVLPTMTFLCSSCGFKAFHVTT